MASLAADTVAVAIVVDIGVASTAVVAVVEHSDNLPKAEQHPAADILQHFDSVDDIADDTNAVQGLPVAAGRKQEAVGAENILEMMGQYSRIVLDIRMEADNFEVVRVDNKAVEGLPLVVVLDD